MKPLLLLILVGLLGLAAHAQAHSTAPIYPLAAPNPAPAKLLSDDPLLQTPVTVDAVEQPLGSVLAALSPTLKLDLTAEQNVADQRVTLHVAGQPVYVLMQQLVLLLSHNAEHPYGYHWGSLERTKGERPDYQLWRDTASLTQEQAERDYPRRELGVFLRDLRHIAQLPPKELAAYQGDFPYKNTDPDDPYNKAVRSLTDDQIDELVNGASVPLDPSLFTTEIADLRQKYHDQIARQQSADWVVQLRAKALAAGQPDPYPDNPPIAMLSPALRVDPADEDGRNLDKVAQFYVYLDGILDSQLVLDTYDTTKSRDPERLFLNLPPDVGPRVDLAPYLAAKTVTPQQKGDLGFTLQALAKAAHLNIYEESFLRTSVQDYQPHPGLDALQGSVPRLVAQVCAVWNYHAYPIPGGYLFWSRTWAQDRASDVPERLIAPWRQRLKKNGTLNFYDRAEIASSLTWPQVALTVAPALFPGEETINTYRELNLFGSLTPSEQAQSLSPDGMAVAEMSARGQAALASDFQKQLVSVPADQLMQSALRFRIEDAPEINVERLIMEVNANEQHLMEARCIRPLQAGKIGKPSQAAETVKPASG